MNVKEFIKTQYNHQPTKEWLDVISEYAKISNYKKAIDIGTASGLSAYAIAKEGKGQIWSVDVRQSGSAERIAKEYGFEKRIEFIKDTSYNLLKHWQRKEPDVDLIVVDGSHDEEDVLSDLEQGWEILKPGGYMIADDIENYGGVVRALKRFRKPYEVQSGKAIFQK